MARKRWRLVAGIAKTHGRKGEIVAVPVDGLPPLLEEGMHIACVPPTLTENRYRVVEHVADGGGSGQRVALSACKTLDEARQLVGRWILVAADDMPEDISRRDRGSLLGRELIDARRGALGTITSVMVGAAHDVWVVEGSFGEVLVPAVPPIVPLVPDEGPISVDLPDGLV